MAGRVETNRVVREANVFLERVEAMKCRDLPHTERLQNLKKNIKKRRMLVHFEIRYNMISLQSDFVTRKS